MPELPQFFVTRQLDRQATAGPGPRYPEQPRVNLGEAGLPGRALQQLGGAIGQLGQEAGQASALLARLDRQLKEEDNEVQRMNALAGVLPKLGEEHDAVLQDATIGPLDKAKAFGERMTAHLDTAGEGLAPKQRAMLRLEMTRHVADTARELRQQGRLKWGEDALKSYSGLMQQYADQEIRTRDPVMQSQLQATRSALTQSMVAKGLLTDQAASQVLQNSTEAVAVGQVQAMMRFAPKRVYDDLQAQMAGEPVDLPQLAAISPGNAVKLRDEAYTHWAKSVQVAEHQEVLKERQELKAQRLKAVELTGKIWALDPTPENASQLQAFQTQSTEMAMAGQITHEDNTRIQNHLRTSLTHAQQPVPEKDDPDVSRNITTLMLTARNDRDLLAAQDMLLQRGNLLKPETYRTLGMAIQSRSTDLTYWKREAYQAGRNRIQGRFVVPGSLMPGGGAKSDAERNLLLALEDYDRSMAELAKQDITVMDREAMPQAERVMERYLRFDPQELPQEFRQLKTPQELDTHLRALKTQGVAPSMLLQYSDWWHLWATSPQGPLYNAPPPAPPPPKGR